MLKAFSGCDTTYKRDSVKIFADPRASFTALTIGCSPFRDTIVNTSLGQDAFTTYYWDFGDGTFDTTYTTGPLYHNYITGVIDTFQLQLIMVNRCARDTQTINVIVSPSNIVEHIAINGTELYGCAPHTVNFQNSSVGAAVLYWDFGDGSPIEAVPATQPVITHTYLTGSVYAVHITLENYCSDTTVDKQVTVYSPPVASFTLLPAVVCTGNSISTNNTSTNANSYEWFWGDASSTAGFNATHTYSTGGIYFVKLVARRLNAFGVVCTDTSAAMQVTVVDKIQALVNISPATSPCAPYTITVSAANAAAASQVDWYFYDSHTAPGIFHVSGPTASYVYNFDGVDSVKLVVVNGAGCKDSTVKSFIVYKTPKAVFTPINIKTCNTDTTATFNVGVDYTGTDPLSYEWFVNGIFAGNSNPFTHQFQASGGVTAINVFTIKVLVKNSFGCGDTATLGNFIIQTLGPRHIVVSPSLVQEQPHYTFSFTDTSVALPNSTYLWFTGDRNGQQLPGKDITYTYGDTGVYKVKLLVQDYETGCSSTDSVNVYILAVPGYLYVPSAFCPGCSKAELRQFLPLGKGLKDYHLIIFNTWGQKVFETSRLDANGVPNEPWNGNWSDGQNLQQGAFSWYIEAHYVNGTEWKGMVNPLTGKLKKQGFISIIR
jgi:PKD repeat protein